MLFIKRSSKLTLSWLLACALVMLLAACSSGGGSVSGPDKPDPDLPKQTVSVSSNLPTDGPGEVGVEYEFEFAYTADSIGLAGVFQSDDHGDARLFVVFGDGKPISGAKYSIDMGLFLDENGVATYTTTHAYDTAGRFGVVFGVVDLQGNQLVSNYLIVEIGAVTEFDDSFAIMNCDGSYSNVEKGGWGVTVHQWDVSGLPQGSQLDFSFEAYQRPDRFIIEYPKGNIVYESGWRGSTGYDKTSMYPGGVRAPSDFSVNDLLTVGTSGEFVVTVIGPDSLTEWEYGVRCRN